jgi:[amino group carrier protein]-6-phospho-L-2-aminoadipate/5-phospho-L-glutamate reductase
MRVAAIGSAGFVGGELLRLLLQHPEVTELVATSRSQAGKPLGEVHPALAGRTDVRFAGLSPAEAARDADVVFLSLEHGESSQIMGEILDAGPGLVVDLAADFRVHDGRLHERYYGRHPAPELVHRFEYGLADVRGAELKGAKAIAAPGCFATAAQLALYPLRRAPLAVEPAVWGITGSSGAGVSPRATTHHPFRANNVFAYSVQGHRHEAELQEQWRTWTGRTEAGPRLLTHSGPFVRGIYATVHARLTGPVGGELPAATKAAFAGRPFVRVLDAPPELTHAVGSNDVLLHVAPTAAGDEVTITVAIDNLVKGAGGQGIQAMNLALGLDERAGLGAASPFPI